MLVPTTTLHTKYFKELFVDDRIQVILPHKKRQFTSNKKTLKKSVRLLYLLRVLQDGAAKGRHLL